MEMHPVCYLEGSTAQTPPCLPKPPEPGAGPHIHPGHAHTHPHTALLYIFFLAKK